MVCVFLRVGLGLVTWSAHNTHESDRFLYNEATSPLYALILGTSQVSTEVVPEIL
jgi:hypothetical protein